MAGKIKVPSELVPSQSNKVMLRSKYIYDDVKGHTQEEVNAALEEQIESKVIEAGGVNWDTVPTANSNNAVKSKDIKAALEKVTGYFVLDSDVIETTVVKTVTVADFPPLAIGGSIKIKMLTKNTATNPTLKIGPASATAYPLYYNEERASAINSWEANEIISVFFDGANYRASNSQGGSNKKIDAYLLGDLRTLAVGQTYKEGESVKTADKQLFTIIKNVPTINLTDTVSEGDVKVYNNISYKAQKSISNYNGTTEENLYAIGSPAGAVIQVTVDDATIAALEEATDITITIAGIDLTVSVDSTMDAATVAAAIVTAFGTQSEWELTDNSDGTITLISKVAKTEAPTISSETGETGVSVDFVEDSAYAGTSVLCKYSNDAWEIVTISNYLADSVTADSEDLTKMWKVLTRDTLQEEIAVQNTETSHIKNYIGDYSQEVPISVPLTTSRTYQITNGVLSIGGNSSSYKGATNPINVRNYSKMYLKYYLASNHTSVTAFTDDNNVVIGGRILNTTRDFIEVKVPYGATKLYMSTHKDYIASCSAIGIIDTSVHEVTDDLYNKLEALKEAGEKTTEINLSAYSNINYRIYSSTGKFGNEKTDKHIFVPVIANAVYKIVVDKNDFNYTWTKSTADGWQADVDYCNGESNVHAVGNGETVFVTAPEDARFIYFTTAKEGVSTRPSYFGRFYDITERLEIIEDSVDTVKESITEIDISESVYPPINYRMIASQGGKFTSSSGTTDKHINVPVIGGATYRMVCPTTQVCGFVTDAMVGTAFGKMPHFCAGTTVMSLAAGTRDITAPLDARFLTLTVRQNGDVNNFRRPTFFARVEKGLVQAAENAKTIMESVKSSDALIFDYYGEKLNLHNKYGLMAVASCYASSLQSTACYGDYTISVNKGVTEMQMRKNTGPLTLTASLPSKGSTDIYHGNQCNFGTQKYNENDFFPVLYVACNNDSNDRCFELVYRIVTTVNEETGEFSSFEAVLVQTIYLPAMTDENSLGNCNIVIDRQRNYMYTYSRNNRVGASNQGIGIITRYSKIPPLFDANLEPITEVYFEDTSAQNPDYYIAEQFDPGMGRIVNGQGGDILNGKLYIVRGGYGVGYTYLYCIDLLQRRLVTLIDLYKVQVAKQQQFNDDNWTFEPEGLYIWKEDLYITTNMSTTVKILT